MIVRFRFPLRERIRVHDRWPIRVGGVVYSFEGDGDEVAFIQASLSGQPVSMAGEIQTASGIPRITLHHGKLLPDVVEHLDHVQCAIGLVLPIEIDTKYHEAVFEPENADERAKMHLFKWRTDRDSRRSNKITFDIAAKGLLCDEWPQSERSAAQFYRRARSAIDQRYYVDSFVNYYFYFERLFAGGKFKKSGVAKQFLKSEELTRSYRAMDLSSHQEAVKKGIPLGGEPKKFFDWMVERRGFFQHQSETDANRWLHSTQEGYRPEAFVLGDLAMSVYFARNGSRIFNPKMDEKYMASAIDSHATIVISVLIVGDDPDGHPIQKRLQIRGPGTKTNHEMARQTALRCMEIAGQELIAVKQITAIVKGTNELLFSYVCSV